MKHTDRNEIEGGDEKMITFDGAVPLFEKHLGKL